MIEFLWHRFCIQFFVDIFVIFVILLMMIILFLFCNLVLLHEDSLLFMKDSEIVDVWMLDHHEPETINGIDHHKQVKINADKHNFFIYYSQYDTARNHVKSEIKFYNANKKMLFGETRKLDRMINYDLSNIEHNVLIFVDCDAGSGDPQMYVVKGNRTIIPIKKGNWKRIVTYDLSANNKFLVVHVRNPYMSKLWDYIFFYDLKTGKNWQYLFPLCLSCKRTKINVEVDDNGQTVVEYKGEHRVFSREGDFIDYYIGDKTQ